jgi:hypothetical protein
MVLCGHSLLLIYSQFTELTTTPDAEGGFTVEVVYGGPEDNEEEDEDGTQRGEGAGAQATLGGIFGEHQPSTTGL